MSLSEDDKKYLLEEAERLKTYAHKRFPNEFVEIQYEGRNALFTPFRDKIFYDKNKNKKIIK